MGNIPPYLGKCPDHGETQSAEADRPAKEGQHPSRLFGGPNCSCTQGFVRKPAAPIRIGFLRIEADGSRAADAPDTIGILKRRAAEKEEETKAAGDPPTSPTGDEDGNIVH